MSFTGNKPFHRFLRRLHRPGILVYFTLYNSAFKQQVYGIRHRGIFLFRNSRQQLMQVTPQFPFMLQHLLLHFRLAIPNFRQYIDKPATLELLQRQLALQEIKYRSKRSAASVFLSTIAVMPANHAVLASFR
jgi:hypothetical protein